MSNPERRKVRLSDWLNGGIGALMVAMASWAGVKLIEVREDVSALRGRVEADIPDMKVMINNHGKTLSNHSERLVKLETRLEK